MTAERKARRRPPARRELVERVAALERRLAALERRVARVEPEARSAHLATMRVGGGS